MKKKEGYSALKKAAYHHRNSVVEKKCGYCGKPKRGIDLRGVKGTKEEFCFNCLRDLFNEAIRQLNVSNLLREDDWADNMFFRAAKTFKDYEW